MLSPTPCGLFDLPIKATRVGPLKEGILVKSDWVLYQDGLREGIKSLVWGAPRQELTIQMAGPMGIDNSWVGRHA